MAKFCSEECEERGPLCDFCQAYSFNPDSEGAYTGKGWCNKFKKPRDPADGDSCPEFACSLKRPPQE